MHQVIMVDPINFDITYALPDNTLMCQAMDAGIRPDRHKASEEWTNQLNIFKSSGIINANVIPGQPRLNDMVFAANAGLPIGNHFIPSNFFYKERQPEKEFFIKYFQDVLGFEIHELSSEATFEGQGDATFIDDEHLVISYGNRTNSAAVREIELILRSIDRTIKVIPIRLKSHRDYSQGEFRVYHQDLGLTPLKMTREVMIYPGAFKDDVNSKLDHSARVLAVTQKEAEMFLCNSLVKDNIIFTPEIGDTRMTEYLDKIGYKIIQNSVLQFQSSGGSVKCLTLELD